MFEEALPAARGKFPLHKDLPAAALLGSAGFSLFPDLRLPFSDRLNFEELFSCCTQPS